MRRAWLLFGVLLLAGLNASAASLRERVAEAEALLNSGEADKALSAFQQIQVDHPDAAEAVLGIGAAQYRAGEIALAGGLNEQARQRFSEAEQTFQRLFSDKEEKVRSSAKFDYANALAKSAKGFDSQKEFTKQVAALKSAIGAYEQVLKDFPDHQAARQNLDHTRYVLKKLLQNKPKDQQQPLVVQLEATTELPRKEAAVQENEVILRDEQQPSAPVEQPPQPLPEEAAPVEQPSVESVTPISPPEPAIPESVPAAPGQTEPTTQNEPVLLEVS